MAGDGRQERLTATWHRLVAVLGLALCVMASSGARAEPCQAPGDLVGLVRLMSVLPPNGGAISPAFADRLSTRIGTLSEVSILRALEEHRMQVLSGIALEIMSEAARLSHPGAEFDGRHVRLMLREFDQQATLACQQAENAMTSTPEELAGVFTEGRVDWDEVDRLLRDNKVVSGGAVVGLLILVIGLLFGADMVVRWAWALVYNRRACRVPATMDVNGTAVPGLVLTLGRGGFRFHPYDMADLTLAEGASVVLHVEAAVPLQAELSRLHEAVADFRLTDALSVKGQNDILAQSTISPYFIRKSRDGGEAEVITLVVPAASEQAGDQPDIPGRGVARATPPRS